MRYALWNVIGVAPRLLSPRLEEPGHRGAEADRLEVAVSIERIIARCSTRPTGGGSRRS